MNPIKWVVETNETLFDAEGNYKTVAIITNCRTGKKLAAYIQMYGSAYIRCTQASGVRAEQVYHLHAIRSDEVFAQIVANEEPQEMTETEMATALKSLNRWTKADRESFIQE